MEEYLARIADSLEAINIGCRSIFGALVVLILLLTIKDFGGGNRYAISEIRDAIKRFVTTYIERR